MIRELSDKITSEIFNYVSNLFNIEILGNDVISQM